MDSVFTAVFLRRWIVDRDTTRWITRLRSRSRRFDAWHGHSHTSGGDQYYDQGAVIKVVRRGETLRGEVEGSQYGPYQVHIDLDDTGIVDTACSCPYDHGGICKHRVAVLLTYIRDPDEISQRPPITDLLADLNRETLYELFIDVLADRPDLADQVERRIESQAMQASADASISDAAHDRHTAPDPDTIRRHVCTIVHSSDARGAPNPRGDVERRVDDLRNLLDEAWAFIDAGEGENALNFLEAVAEELMDEEWLALSYDDSPAIFEVLDELGMAFTEAILSTDLSETVREEWANRLGDWADELSGYGVNPSFAAAAEAATQGWKSESLQEVLRGEISEDIWEGDRPWYADDLTTARLNVLERQDRTEAYLHLANAAGQTEQYATKLVEVGRYDEAVDYTIDHLSTPSEAFTVAKTLREHDHPNAAIRIAEHGLTVDGVRNLELAEWLRDVASANGDDETAVQAAVAAFEADPSLDAYQAAEEVAGDDWPNVHEELLDHLEGRSPGRSSAQQHVEIFLSEDMIDEAITVAEHSGHYSVVEPVVDAVWEERPQWTLQACN